ncbi:COX assembly mitochondrial protein-like protein [Frankliniella fusca]|uniref:COX assembly mitochondrial protein n=1 Tax=Frankliniella fusca TaxID=407009 RepID=A0AAE1LKD9_9NEOP|nr:COX assembly mitochondrial protein-like protein [Frankliniella fusca]
MEKDEVYRYWLAFIDGFNQLRRLPVLTIRRGIQFLAELAREPTLEDTIIEKIGGGPHGYGDPADTSIRREEVYLFPPMIWRKVRFEKCADVTENYYKCIAEKQSTEDCKSEELALYQCKTSYYNPEKIDEVENECIQQYIKLRSKFRETGSEEDLWKIKMMLLDPRYDVMRNQQKTVSK